MRPTAAIKFDRRLQPVAQPTIFSPKDQLHVFAQPLPPPEPPRTVKQPVISDEEESDDELTIDEIIKTKPDAKVVREFFKFNVGGISDD